MVRGVFKFGAPVRWSAVGMLPRLLYPWESDAGVRWVGCLVGPRTGLAVATKNVCPFEKERRWSAVKTVAYLLK
jgi:hypothetical protein